MDEAVLQLNELLKAGLITNETFATCLKDIKNSANKTETKELTEEEKRDELIAKNRERAEENRKNVEAIRQRDREEYIRKQREKEISNFESFLKKIPNSRGERVYTDEQISRMSFVEMQILYQEIISKMTEEEIAKINASKEIVEKRYVGIEELLSSSMTKREEALKKMDELKEEPNVEPAKVEEEVTKEIPKEEVTKEVLKEEPTKEEVTKEIPKEDSAIDSFDQNIGGTDEVTGIVPSDEEIENAAKSSTEKEPDSSVKRNTSYSEEDKAKLKSSKMNAKKVFLTAGIVASAGLLLGTGAILGGLEVAGGLVAYNVLAKKIREGTWNPTTMFGRHVKEYTEWVMNKLNTPKKGKSK